MTALTFDQARQLPAGELARCSPVDLYHLKLDAAEQLKIAKDCAAHIDRALELRYGATTQALRQQQGKDSGVVQVDDGPVRVTASLPKQVEWDQAKLAEIVARIRDGGEDPSEFVQIQYRVDERKYSAWPSALQAAFAPARTLSTGKPGFRLALIGEGGDA